jgi:site-specific recombinase XerD
VLYLAELTAQALVPKANGAVTTGPEVVTTPVTSESQEFLTDREARGLSRRTIQFYHEKLSHVSRIKPLLSITRPELQQILIGLPCNAGGKMAYLRALRAFYSWAEDNGLVTANPCRRLTIKVPKPLRYTVPVEAIPTLLAACESPRDRLIVSMLADTGLRLSELAGITESNIDRHSQTIRVWGKGAKQRVVRYGPYTASLLDSAPQTGGSLIGLAPRGIQIMLTRLGQRAGVKCNAHAFRRTFATQQIRSGMNLFYVQSLLGHEDLTMTRIYAQQVNSEDAIKAYRPVVVDAL